MKYSLRYRETQFSPSEAAAITDVALHLQRDWRSQGLLKAREGGRASFTPRELAEMRLMVKLRAYGLSLADSRRVAEEAAPGVIFAALADRRSKALAVDAPENLATAYLEALERGSDDGYLALLSDLSESDRGYRYAVIENGRCSLLKELNDDAVDEDVEVAGVINLSAVARAMVEAAPRPLFTLLLPRDFRPT